MRMYEKKFTPVDLNESGLYTTNLWWKWHRFRSDLSVSLRKLSLAHAPIKNQLLLQNCTKFAHRRCACMRVIVSQENCKLNEKLNTLMLNNCIKRRAKITLDLGLG